MMVGGSAPVFAAFLYPARVFVVVCRNLWLTKGHLCLPSDQPKCPFYSAQAPLWLTNISP